MILLFLVNLCRCSTGKWISHLKSDPVKMYAVCTYIVVHTYNTILCNRKKANSDIVISKIGTQKNLKEKFVNAIRT